MKTIIQILAITFFTAQTSQAFFLNKETRSVNKQIENINHLENENQLQEAFHATVQLQKYLEDVLKVNQIVTSVESILTEINQEQVISSQKAGFSLFGLLISGGGSYSSQSTDMFLVNGDEKNNFSSKKRNDLLKIKLALRDYLSTNIDGIVLLKLVHLKMWSLAYRLDYTDVTFLENLSQLNTKISFSGLQKVTHCVQNNYINNTTTASAGISLLGLIGFSANYESTVYARTTKSCQSSFNKINSDRDPLLLISLNHLDDKILAIKKLVFAAAVSKSQADYFPTFDSPYYK